MIIKTLSVRKFTIFIPIIIMFIVMLNVIIFDTYSSVPTSNNSDIISEKKDFIKWVDFNVCYEALDKTAKLDISSHNSDSSIKYDWIELLSYLACKYGGDFKKFKQSDLDQVVQKLESGQSMETIIRKYEILFLL